MKKYHKNPRKITRKQVAQLRETMEELGDLSGIVHDINSDEIIGGNQRCTVMDGIEVMIINRYNPPTRTGTVAEGFVEFEGERFTYRQVDWSPEQCEKANIVANKGGGDWDMDMLANQFDMDDLFDWGFEPWEFGLNPEEAKKGEDPGPGEPPAEPRTQSQMVYELGSHRLICGNSTDPETIGKLMNGEKADIMVTDPPYGVEYDPSWRHEAGINQSQRIGVVHNDDRADWRAAWALFEGDVAYVWHAGLKTAEVLHSLQAIGLMAKSQIIWNKGRLCIGRSHYHWAHEPCWFCVRDKKTANWAADRKQTTVWDIDMVTNHNQDMTTEHGTQKPVECMARAIRNHAGSIVYDPFGRSGTTLIACEQLDRACRMAELSPGYCDVIIERYCKMKDIDPEEIFDQRPVTLL